MENENLNPNESLEIINKMIAQTRNKIADDGYFFMLWGWLVSISSLFSYLAIYTNWHAYVKWIWLVFISLGVVLSIIKGRKEKKNRTVKTYVDDYLKYLWMILMTTMGVALILMKFNGIAHTYFTLILIYAIGSVATGALIEFKPLIYGGFTAVLFSIASVFVNEETQLLVISGALFCSHIIPGHLLNSKFKSIHV